MRVRSMGRDGIDERIEVVAADAPQHLRKPPLDLGGMPEAELGNLAIGAGLDAIARPRPRELLGGQRPEMRERSVGEHDALFEDVIDGLAEQHRAGAARVVGHHAAHGGAARRRHIGREPQLMRPQRRVELVEHHPGLDPRPALVRIDLENAIQVLRRVEHQSGADRLPGLRRAAAARGDRHAVAGGDLDGADHRLRRSWYHHPQRLDLIDARVGGVERPREAIETDLAVDGGFELALQNSIRNPRSGDRAIVYWLLPRAAIGHTASTRSPRSAWM